MHSIAKHAISTDVVSKTELFIIPARTALGLSRGTLIIGLSTAGGGLLTRLTQIIAILSRSSMKIPYKGPHIIQPKYQYCGLTSV